MCAGAARLRAPGCHQRRKDTALGAVAAGAMAFAENVLADMALTARVLGASDAKGPELQTRP